MPIPVSRDTTPFKQAAFVPVGGILAAFPSHSFGEASVQAP
jgi:hypothetical protein